MGRAAVLHCRPNPLTCEHVVISMQIPHRTLAQPRLGERQLGYIPPAR